MSKLLIALTFLATATGTLATRLIWTLFTDPTSMVAAAGSGSLRVLAAALFGAQ